MKKLILNILKENEDKLFDKFYRLIKNYFKGKFDSGSWTKEKYDRTLTIYDEGMEYDEQDPYLHIVFEYNSGDVYVSLGTIDLLWYITGEPWSYNKWFIDKFIQEEFKLEVDSVQVL